MVSGREPAYALLYDRNTTGVEPGGASGQPAPGPGVRDGSMGRTPGQKRGPWRLLRPVKTGPACSS